ncbi:MAG: hypothetical protein SPI83_01360 [Rothia sp. (in: high G+C Gram-positive bacteria)]|nr:hypothetical protein [Rothia sp. (in: high G+C Gram-positive bacteria)]
MDIKDLSPAYLTSLAAIFAAALMVSANSTWVSVLGWVLILVSLGLNAFATLVMVQRIKGGPLPALITGANSHPQVEYEEEEGAEASVDLYEPEATTESQPLVSPAPSSAASDERIFRSRAPRPRVR